MIELKRNEEGLLIYDLDNFELDFGEKGRVEVSDWILKREYEKTECYGGHYVT